MPVYPRWILLPVLCCFCMITTVQPRPETEYFPQQQHNDDRIVFREKDKMTVQNGNEHFTPKVERKKPKCASKDSTYCEADDSYPREHIQNLLQNLKTKNKFLYDLALKKDELEFEIQDRLKENEYTLCKSQKRVVKIESAENKDAQWLYIVKDGIEIEICIENSSCAYVEAPPEMTSSCVQKYATRNIPSLSKNGGEIILDQFMLPSCCSCQLVQINSRMNFLKPNTSPALPRSKVFP